MEYSFGIDIRVRFSETDAQGVVHNSQYLSYFEVGRIEYMRKLGLPYQELMKRGYDFLLVVSHVEYRKAARFDQNLHLVVAIKWVKQSSFQFTYQLTDTVNHLLIAEGYTTHATIDRQTWKPCGLPKDIKTKIEQFEGRNLEKNIDE